MEMRLKLKENCLSLGHTFLPLWEASLSGLHEKQIDHSLPFYLPTYVLPFPSFPRGEVKLLERFKRFKRVLLLID